MSNVSDWSRTAAGNAVAFDDIDWRDGIPRAEVKENGRAMMAAVARFYDSVGASAATVNADGYIPSTLIADIRAGTSTVDLTSYIALAVTAAGTAGKVVFGRGQYSFNAVIPNRVTFQGVSKQATIFRAFSSATPVIMHTDTGSARQFQYIEHRDFSMIGPGYLGLSGQAGEGIRLGPATYSTGAQLGGAVGVRNVGAYGFDKGFSKPWGSIGFYAWFCNGQFNNYDFHFKSYDGGGIGGNVMHAGCDYIYGGEYNSSLLAHLYIDSPLAGTGQVIYDAVIDEGHRGFVFFIKSWNAVGALPTIDIRGGWNEENSNQRAGFTGGTTVTIDGVAYTPRYLYAKDTTLINFNDTAVGQMQLVNSVVRTYRCNIDLCGPNVIDGNSSLEHNEARTDSLNTRDMVRSWALSTRKAGGQASVVRMPHRNGTSKTWAKLYANDATSVIAYTGTASGNTTAVTTDGTTFGTSQDLAVGASDVFQIGAFAVPTNKYVVAIVSAKCISGNGVNVLINGSATLAQFGNWTDTTDWQTMVLFTDTIGQASLATEYFQFGAVSGSSTIRIGGLAILLFDKKQHADAFLASGVFPL